MTRKTKLDNRAEMDQALDEKPPRIRWASNGKGIQVAVEVDDPHTEKAWRPYDERSAE